MMMADPKTRANLVLAKVYNHAPLGVLIASKAGVRYEEFSEYDQVGNFSIPCSAISEITTSVYGSVDVHTAT